MHNSVSTPGADHNSLNVTNPSLKEAQEDPLYNHPDIFDIAYPGYEGDVEFYRREARVQDVLYFGTGSGRVFGEVCKENPEALGVDNCREMIKILLDRNPHIREDQVISGDIRDVKFPHRSFDKIIAPYSFLTHFSEDEMLKVLWNVRKWLKPNGQFVTDLFSPYQNPNSKQQWEEETKEIQGSWIRIQRIYDHIHQKITEITNYKSPTQNLSLRLDLQYFYPNQIRFLVEESELRICELLGGFDNEDFTVDSPLMLYRMDK